VIQGDLGAGFEKWKGRAGKGGREKYQGNHVQGNVVGGERVYVYS